MSKMRVCAIVKLRIFYRKRAEDAEKEEEESKRFGRCKLTKTNTINTTQRQSTITRLVV